MLEHSNFYFDLDGITIETEALKCLTKEQCEKYEIFPYKLEGDILYLAIEALLKIEIENELKFTTKKELEFNISTKSQIRSFINRYYGKDYTNKILSELQHEKAQRKYEFKGDKAEDVSIVGPAIEAVDSIIINGINNNASDIHIEPFKDYVILRFRIDGVLKVFSTFSKNIYDSLCTRIKIISKMNIAYKHLPQDGKFSQIINGEDYDFRVSSLPTINGEKFVIRILRKNASILTLTALGFTSKDAHLLEEVIRNRQGLILITGPTGSGKSTTLYAMLKSINEENRNLVTIEEPVEYRIDRVNQVNINNQGELTFDTVLRAVLRQDPDVIMVGEIIDGTTAETAVRASLTGHLVLTTLHTNDAASSINRLIDMKVPAYLISDSVVVVIAQRLARKICECCKFSYKPTYSERVLLNLKEGSSVHRGKGCPKCKGTGYNGRTVAYELMVIDERHRKIISSSNSSEDLRRYSINSGMVPLRDYFRELVVLGHTTIEEYLYNIQETNQERFLEDYDAI